MVARQLWELEAASSSLATRTTSEQTALHSVPRRGRGTSIPLRLFFLSNPKPPWASDLFFCAPLRRRAQPKAVPAGIRSAPFVLPFKSGPAPLGSGFVFLRSTAPPGSAKGCARRHPFRSVCSSFQNRNHLVGLRFCIFALRWAPDLCSFWGRASLCSLPLL